MSVDDRVTQRHLHLLPPRLTCLPGGQEHGLHAAPSSEHDAAATARLQAVQHERVALEQRLAGLLREERELRLSLAQRFAVAPEHAVASEPMK
jgi:hypothetical protein